MFIHKGNILKMRKQEKTFKRSKILSFSKFEKLNAYLKIDVKDATLDAASEINYLLRNIEFALGNFQPIE
jgi:hypothetical protein